jgi:hypothetical protein
LVETWKEPSDLSNRERVHLFAARSSGSWIVHRGRGSHPTVAILPFNCLAGKSPLDHDTIRPDHRLFAFQFARRDHDKQILEPSLWIRIAERFGVCLCAPDAKRKDDDESILK